MTVDQDAPPRASAARTAVDDAATLPDGWLARLLIIGIGLAVVVAGALFRFWTRSDLWFDEALSVNISRLPIDQIPDALRRDGHPPLYYFLLHGWIEIFGLGNLAVRSLSGVISVLTLPVAWFAGRRVGGQRVAWITVVVLALSPFAFRFGTEARMYSLVILFVFAGYLALRRALERPTLGRLTLVAVLTALLSLSQYWCLYLLAVVGAGLAWRAWRGAPGPERGAARRVFAAMSVGGLGFVPWLPVFLDQLAHTGTPWGDPQYPWVAVPRSLIAFAGSDSDGEAFLLAFLLIVLPLLAVFGRGLDRRRIELDLGTQPAVRWEGAAALSAFLLGSAASYLSNTTFEPRYAATVFALFVLLTAYGVTVFRDGRIQLGVLLLITVLGVAGGVRNVVTQRTQAGQVADVIAAEARPGDVVAYCPDQLGPAVSRLLRDEPGLVQMTFPDGARPERVDWRDYLERNRAVPPERFADRVVTRAGDHTIWYVTGTGQNNIPGVCEGVAGSLAKARPGPVGRVTIDDDIFEYDGLTQYPGP